MQVSTSLQKDNHAAPYHSVFSDWMPFLPPNQQHQSTEGLKTAARFLKKFSFIFGTDITQT